MSNVYIQKARRDEIPNDAVILTKKEALDMQWKMINSWRPKTDTWPFTIGIGFLTSMNAATNVTIVKHFRDKLSLGNYGRVTMVLPTVAIPCIVATTAHYMLVTSDILLGQTCPMCVTTRATLLQIGCGVVLPFIATPFAAFFYAHSYATYNVPTFSFRALPQILGLWFKLTKRLRSNLPIIVGLNAITASVLTHFEAKAFYEIQSKVHEKEQDFIKLMAERGASEED